MTVMMLDAAEDFTADLPAIARAGYKDVGGYLSSISPDGAKCITPERARSIAKAGLNLVLVHEGWGGVDGKGISAADGKRDGAFCVARAALLGAGNGACIYFACDQDFTAAQIEALVLPYFRAIRAAFAGSVYRVGVYGSGAVCQAVIGGKLADLSWEAQSRGWTGYAAWKAKADILQGPSGHVAGISADTDQAAADIGAFVPFAHAVETAEDPPIGGAAEPQPTGGWLSSFLKKLAGIG